MANEDLAKVDTYLQYLNLYRRSCFPLQNQCFFFEKTIFSQFDFFVHGRVGGNGGRRLIICFHLLVLRHIREKWLLPA